MVITVLMTDVLVMALLGRVRPGWGAWAFVALCGIVQIVAFCFMSAA